MIVQISKDDFYRTVVKYHYSKVLPKLTKYYLGDEEFGGVISLGWGVRPVHTIRKLFPSLGTKDYYEIGKMCLPDEMPRNTETRFISRVVEWVKEKEPDTKLIFTWADGMVGKCGYVYQAAGFLYGGFIWTDTYFTSSGEKVHPRMTGKIGGRPDQKYMHSNGWVHYRGKQFRYIRFLCSNKERKLLLKESTVSWNMKYPKNKDLEWKKQVAGKWMTSSQPQFNSNSLEFNTIAQNNIQKLNQGKLFTFAK